MSFHFSQEILTRLYKNSKIFRFSDSKILLLQRLADLSCQELSVHSCDVSYRDTFWTFCHTCVCVWTVTESEFVHSCDHLLYSFVSLDLTLWQQSELWELSWYEEHSATVFTCCHASAAAYTWSSVHREVSVMFVDRYCVSVWHTACTSWDVTAWLDETI